MTAPTNPDAETTPSRAVVVSDACSVAFSGGVADLRIGDRFEIRYVEPYGPDGLYEIAELQSEMSYSPSGIGGTPTILGRHVETGKTVEFCGDSVAGAVVRYRNAQNINVTQRAKDHE